MKDAIGQLTAPFRILKSHFQRGHRHARESMSKVWNRAPQRLQRFLRLRWLELRAAGAFTLDGSAVNGLLPHLLIWVPILLVHMAVVWWMPPPLVKFGVPYLFWHDDPCRAFWAGLATTVFVSCAVFSFFAIDYSSWIRKSLGLVYYFNRKSLSSRKHVLTDQSIEDFLQSSDEASRKDTVVVSVNSGLHVRAFDEQSRQDQSFDDDPKECRRPSKDQAGLQRFIGLFNKSNNQSPWIEEVSPRSSSGQKLAKLTNSLLLKASTDHLKHWTNELYDDLKINDAQRIPAARDPDGMAKSPEDAQRWLDLLAYFYNRLFCGVMLIWLLSFIVSLCFSKHDPDHAKVIEDLFTKPAELRWALIAGFAVGVWIVIVLNKRLFPLVGRRIFFPVPCKNGEVRRLVGKLLSFAGRIPLFNFRGVTKRGSGNERAVESMLLLYGCVVITGVVVVHAFLFHFFQAQAVPAICVYFSEVVLLYAMVVILWRWKAWLVTLSILGLITIAGVVNPGPRYPFNPAARQPYKPIPKMEGGAVPLSSGAPNLYRGDVKANWWRREQPLVIVCASGGGITAEHWTLNMLSRMDAILSTVKDEEATTTPFSRNVRVITGASGGMVGASAWVGLLHRARELHIEEQTLFKKQLELLDKAGADQLSPVVHRMMLSDWSWFGLMLGIQNRGWLLEDVWDEKFRVFEDDKQGLSSLTLGSLMANEGDGFCPSLIFSPIICEDGRRMLISNLELSRLAHVVRPGDKRSVAQPSIEAWDILSPEDMERTTICTWSRMSATFPFISPPTSLPTEPRIHVLDAGYYDNSGINLAAGWLREYWLPALRAPENHAPRHVILILLDAYPRFSDPEKIPQGVAFYTEDYVRPFVGLSNLSQAVSFRNEEEIEALSISAAGIPGVEFNVFRFTNVEAESLSWYLSLAERERLVKWSKVVTGEIETHEAEGLDGQHLQQCEDSIRDFQSLRKVWREARWKKPEPATSSNQTKTSMN